MAGKVSFIFILALSTCLVNKSEEAAMWTRDKNLDNVIKVDSSSHTEEKAAINEIHCASLCGSASWCSSFFFLRKTQKCLLNELVFAKPDGGQSSPGVTYYKAYSAACSSDDGFVWLRGQHTCIKFYPSPTSFTNAYERCRSVGSRLAVLDTGDKIRAVAAYMADRDKSVDRVLIGGVRDGVVNGTRMRWDNTLDPLYWLNGAIVPTSGSDLYWHRGEPNNQHGVEGCMELIYGLWNDVPCNDSKYFICEKVLN